MCGLCLPHCPTYAVSQTESESPRGRISLVKAYMQGQLQHSAGLTQHLESCTGCFQCQRVCPAKVEYDDIIDAGRAAYRKNLSISTKLMQRLSIATLTSQRGQKFLHKASTISRRIPMLHKSRVGQLLMLAQQDYKPTQIMPASDAMIFAGCTGNVFDQTTMRSLSFLMRKLGIEPHIPALPLCCGALAQHSGLPNKAEQHRQAIEHYCETHKIKQVVSIASGCSRELNKYLPVNTAQHLNAHEWLLSQKKLVELPFKPLEKRVLMHIPCSMHAQEKTNMQTILSTIPELNLIEFDDDLSCCGAGGMQLLSPNKSNTSLALHKVTKAKKLQADIIVSANIGCAMQFRQTLAQQALDIEVIHPITLLARQLQH